MVNLRRLPVASRLREVSLAPDLELSVFVNREFEQTARHLESDKDRLAGAGILRGLWLLDQKFVLIHWMRRRCPVEQPLIDGTLTPELIYCLIV